MSATDNTTKETRAETSSDARSLAGLIRRMAVTLTSGGFWQVIGHLLFDGVTREARAAEVFGTLGFYSRPKAAANAEAIVVFPGGAANPVIIGTRDEDLRKAQVQLEQDSSLMCNRATLILIKPDGTVEIRASSGAAAALATKADIDALKSYIATHAHTGVTTGAGTSGPPASAPPSAAGTTVLRAQ